VERATLAPGRWRAAAAAGLALLREAAAAADGPLALGCLDEALLTHERLRERAGHPGAIALEPGWREEWALAAIGRGLAATLAEAPPAPAPSQEALA
jgi:hypothetical protein